MVTLLQITLIILKALGYISWWAVFAPYIVSGLLFLIWLVSTIVVSIRNERRFREKFKD